MKRSINTPPIIEALEPRLFLSVVNLLGDSDMESATPYDHSAYTAGTSTDGVWHSIYFDKTADIGPNGVGDTAAQASEGWTGIKLLQGVDAPANGTSMTLAFDYSTISGDGYLNFVRVMGLTNGQSFHPYNSATQEGVELQNYTISKTSSWASVAGEVFTLNGTYDKIVVVFETGMSDAAKFDNVELYDGIYVSNTPPTAHDDSATVSKKSLLVDKAVATDPNPTDIITYELLSSPSHGTLTSFNTATGDYTYDPVDTYEGPDSFTFRAYDGEDYSDPATISITVNTQNPVNLLTNSDFETGDLTEWSTGVGRAITTTNPHGGTYAVALDNATTRQRFDTVVGVTYRATAWFRFVSETVTGPSPWGGVTVAALGTPSNDYESVGSSPTYHMSSKGDGWFEGTVTFTAQVEETFIKVGAFSGDRDIEVVTDDVQVFVKPTINTAPIISNVTVSSITDLSTDQTFSATVEDADGSLTQVYWDFGDGDRAFGHTSGVRHVTATGSFSGTVYAVDDDGAIVEQGFSWSASDAAVPVITVTSPPTTVTTNSASLSGTISTSSLAVVLTSDRGEYVTAGVVGTAWTATMPLSPGYNRILAQVTDADGDVATEEFVVRYNPSGSLGISGVVESAGSVEKWKEIEVTFAIDNSAATHTHLPYTATPAAGNEWVDGITVDVEFWNHSDIAAIVGDANKDGVVSAGDYAAIQSNYGDTGAPGILGDADRNGTVSAGDYASVQTNFGSVAAPSTSYTRPAFLFQDYDLQTKSNLDWLYPTGTPVWTVRFAPPSEGEWSYKIHATEAKGTTSSSTGSFTTTAVTDPDNHGPVVVSSTDSRYFEYADGTPFLGGGLTVGPVQGAVYTNLTAELDAIGEGNAQMLRWWSAGQIWSSAWTSWRHPGDQGGGNTPETSLSVDSGYANSTASVVLTPETDRNLVFQGWGTNKAGLVIGETYRVVLRVRTEDVTGPSDPADPYGLVFKKTAWPETGTSQYDPITTYVTGDTPWHTIEGTFVADSVYMGSYATVVLENCTAGTAYVDQISLYEVQPDGSNGPQLFSDSDLDMHQNFDDRHAKTIETVVDHAETLGITFKMLIEEKEDWLLPHLSDSGLPTTAGDSYFDTDFDSAGSDLREAYWRYLFARIGSSNSIHSWELVNEASPYATDSFEVADYLGELAAADGNPHLATHSTWGGQEAGGWQYENYDDIAANNFHAYTYGNNMTNYLTPTVTDPELHVDSARFFADYDRYISEQGFTKPTIWGEMGMQDNLSSSAEETELELDTEGVWLHKIQWARTGSGGVYPIQWYTDNLFEFDLHNLYGNWLDFMDGIELTNGNYVDANAAATNSELMVLGQKDTANGSGHLWINNKGDTWRYAAYSVPVTDQSGTVTIDMGEANADYVVTWYNTGDKTTGISQASSSTISADGSGVVSLTVTNLGSDIAVKLVRTVAAPMSSAMTESPAGDNSTTASATTYSYPSFPTYLNEKTSVLPANLYTDSKTNSQMDLDINTFVKVDTQPTANIQSVYVGEQLWDLLDSENLLLSGEVSDIPLI